MNMAISINNQLNHEERLIGACICHRHKLSEIMEIVSKNDFQNPLYGCVFEQVCDVKSISDNADHIAVCDAIAEQYKLSAPELYSLCTFPYPESYMLDAAKQIKTHSIERQLKGKIKIFINHPTSQQILQEIVDEQAKLANLTGQNEFAEIIPLDESDVPVWPENVFPEWLENMVMESARFIEVPIELSAMLALGVLATCVQKKFSVSPKPGYVEPLNIWILTVLPSGNRKSAALSCLTDVLSWYQQESHEQLKPEINKIKQSRIIIETKLNQQLNKLKKSTANKDDELVYRDMQQQLDELKVPIPLQLWSQDITPEAIPQKLAEQRGAFSILSAEGGIFDTIAGRYNSNIPNLDACLQAHSGDSICVDRCGKESIFIMQPALTLNLAVQPSVLKEIFKKPGFRGRGLLARFFYCCPESMVGFRTNTQEPIRPGVIESYETNIRKLLSAGNITRPITFSFSPEANQRWQGFGNHVELELRIGGKYDHLPDLASKILGGVARIAGLIHCAKYLDEAVNHPCIDETTMQQALEIGATLLKHALLAFDHVGADEKLEKAKKILRWLKEQTVPVVTRRELDQRFKHDFNDILKIDSVLDILVERNYLKRKQFVIKKRGRPSEKYIINPIVKR